MMRFSLFKANCALQHERQVSASNILSNLIRNDDSFSRSIGCEIAMLQPGPPAVARHELRLHCATLQPKASNSRPSCPRSSHGCPVKLASVDAGLRAAKVRGELMQDPPSPLRGGRSAKRDGWGQISLFPTGCRAGPRPPCLRSLVARPHPAFGGHPPRKGEGFARGDSILALRVSAP
jgi:hypothetical protein